MEKQFGPFPEHFKQELKEYIGQFDMGEDNQKFLDKKYKDAKKEDPTMPSKLDQLKDFANAPYSNENRNEYVKALRLLEANQDRFDKEPSKTKLTEHEIDEALKKQ